MKLANQVLKLCEALGDKRIFDNADEVTNGLKVGFIAMQTQFYLADRTILFTMDISFRKKEDQRNFIEIAKKYFSEFDYSKTRNEIVADVKFKDAYKKFMEEVRSEADKELERFGLGKSPYKFLGTMESPSKEMQEQNPEAYNNALRDFPKFDAGGIGSCARCYNAITIHYIIKSSDGKVFPLGSECVGRLHDAKLTKEAEKEAKKITKEKTTARNDKKKDELSDLMNDEEVINKLKSMPKEKHKDYDKWDANKKQWWDDKFKDETKYDEIQWLIKQSGTSGKIKVLKELKKILGK